MNFYHILSCLVRNTQTKKTYPPDGYQHKCKSGNSKYPGTHWKRVRARRAKKGYA